MHTPFRDLTKENIELWMNGRKIDVHEIDVIEAKRDFIDLTDSSHEQSKKIDKILGLKLI